MMRICDNCQNSASDPLFENPDYISGERFPVLLCQACGLVRTDFDPQTQTLSAYYPASYYGESGKRFPAPLEWLIRRFRLARVAAILAHHPQAGRILDMGCGRGLMLAEFQARGWEAIGTEFSAELAAAVSQEHGFQVYPANDLSVFPDDFFEVVTLWHVLEHVPHPIQTLQEIRRILKPKGILLIEVPNLGSWQARLGGGRWFHLDCPRHLYHFSKDHLKTILVEQGFSPRQSTTLSLEYGYYGFLQTLLNRFTSGQNVLYARLKNTRSQADYHPRDEVISLVWLPILGLVSLVLETLAIVRGRGGVIRWVAD